MTKDELKLYLESRREGMAIPYLVEQWAEKNAGKLLRSNNIPENSRIVKHYGWTSLVFESMIRVVDNAVYGYDFMLQRKEVDVHVPTVGELRDNNGGYYKGAEDRNALRQVMRVCPNRMEKIVEKINLIQELRDTYLSELEEFEKNYLQYEGPLSPDSFNFRAMLGIPKK